MMKPVYLMAATALSGALFGCSTPSPSLSTPDVPVAIAVPAGNKLAMMLVGTGELTYECRAKAGAAGTFEWAFAGPNAVLSDGRGAAGKYYGGPTWESNDGSKVTGKQLATAPAVNPGAIPLQLVQANPATGNGVMTGVTFIQRLKTIGGAAPAAACDSASVGSKKQVNYQADYLFYKAT